MTKQELLTTAGTYQLLVELVHIARERAQTADGTGRWRWHSTADVVKRWCGEPVEEICEKCGQTLIG